MRPKLNLKDKGQMSIANEHNDTFYVTYLEFKDPYYHVLSPMTL